MSLFLRLSHVLASVVMVLLSTHFSYAQRSFFDRFANMETWPNVAVDTDPVGGVIIANDLASGAEQEHKHGFYTAAYDSCANLRWTKAYHIPEFALFFNDLAVDAAGFIWVAGQTGRRDLFVMKLASNGDPLWMRTYQASTYDQCFSLSLNEDAAYLYGSYQDEGNARSLLIRLDLDGEIVWARGNRSIIGKGAAAIGRDQIYCRADDVLFALDTDGNTLWANQIQDLNDLDAFFSDPVPTSNGFGVAWFSMAAGGQRLSTFNEFGNLVNSSVLLTENPVPVSIAYRAGRFHAAAALPTATGSVEAEVVLFEMDEHLRVRAAQSFIPWIGKSAVRLDLALQDMGNPVLVGSVRNLGPHTDFVAQFSETDTDQLCVAQQYEPATDDDFYPNLSPITILHRSPIIEMTDTLLPVSYDHYVNEVRECGWETGFADLALDSSILCRDTLHYQPNIQNASFRWWDGNTNGNRILQAPGSYQLTATTCRTDFDIQIELRLGFCPCSFFVPNAFSPNGDDVNDTWQPYADCPYQNYRVQVFNRWGSPVFSSNRIEQGWDGKVRGQNAPVGTYLYLIDYEYEIQPGLWQSVSDRGTINLLR